MDIKEIALKVADSLRNKVDGVSHMQSNQGLVRFAEALIESYKAELLKEVTSKDVLGEPVAYFSDEFFSVNTKQNATFNEPLFSSNQVAAAILKATKPMKHELRELRMSTRMRGEDIDELRAQLAATQEETRLLTERNATNEEYAANLVKALTKTQDQLAKAEQRVADACADLLVDRFKHEVAGTLAIRAGEWRKFVKEV